MNILLETCTFLWIVAGSDELPESARRVFTDPGNEVYLSVASAWEIIVKHQLGKLPLPEPPRLHQKMAHSTRHRLVAAE